MSPSGPLVSALATLVLLGVACTPSSNAGPASRACADSAPETKSAPEAKSEAAPEAPAVAPDVSADGAPEVARPPRPPVVSRPVYVPQPAGPYKVRVVDEAHHDLPRFANGGRTYVMGTIGSRYSIVIANPTARRVEVVLSVDGLDAMDGQPANYAAKRGYILPAYGDATIDGFRTSLDDVATFRFSSVADSYAGRLGQARDVGVIGVAFFPERAPVTVWQPPSPPPYYEPSPHARATPSRPAPKMDDLASSSSSPSGGGAGGGASGSAQAAPSTAGADAANETATKRRGLGTEFGEARASRVETTEFARANASHPSQVVSIRYNDRAGLLALGIAIPQPYAAVESDLRLRESADPFRENRFAQPPP